MKNGYMHVLFAPKRKNAYAGQHKWSGSIIGVEVEPFVNNEKQAIYRVSPFWKAVQFAKDKEAPAFGYVNIDDLEPVDKSKHYGTFQNHRKDSSVGSTVEECETVGECCSFLFGD